ncbi:MAG: TonB-dependent receptor [Paludibacter sp.]
MNKLKLLFLFYIFTANINYAQNYTVSGYITMKESGETIINSTIFEKKTGGGTVSNSYGFYSLTLPMGKVNLRYSYVGFVTQTCDFNLVKDTVINIKLSESTELDEVTILGNRKGMDVKSSQMSLINIPITQIKNVPSLLGETDVIKVLQLLPGVNAGTEGSAGMYVRGGGPDENLLILDGVPVYNVNHLFGFFSVFNADAIKDVTLYKGSFPARFGGRLSSVVDIKMNDGNDKEIHGNVSIGLISSKINIEGPIIKEKTTFNISARRTYADLFATPFIPLIDNADKNGGVGTTRFGYYFYDLNGKISHKFSDKDRLYLSAYIGEDVIYGDMQQYKIDNGIVGGIETGRLKLGWNWGNMITALRWNHIINNKLFMNTTTSYTRYRFKMSEGTEVLTVIQTPPTTTMQQTDIGYKSGIDDYAAKVDFDWSPSPNHNVKFGANYIYHTFRPGVNVLKLTSTDSTNTQLMDTTYGDQNVTASEISAYFEDNISLSQAIELNLGLNYSAFLVQNRYYNSLPQPRIGLRVLLNNHLSIKAGFASMSQYIHLLSNSNISLPTDLWVPVTKRISPMQSIQYSAGVFYNFKNIVDFSVEAYYKSMNNLIEYKDGASFLGSSTGWEDKVNMGRGWAYGIEFMAQKTVGKTTGWIGYTWSKTERLFDRPNQEINYGTTFPAKYDRPHSFSLVVMHKFSNRFDIAGTWVISSGNCGTLALQNYDGTQLPQTNLNNFVGETNTLPYISNRNNYRYETYHRLDLGINFHKQKKHGLRTWNISVYNAYNQLNPFLVSVTKETVIDTSKGVSSTGAYTKTISHLTQTSIFPIIPSVSYSYKF